MIFDTDQNKITREKAEQITLVVEKANRNVKLVNHKQAQGEVQVANTEGGVLKFEGN